VTFDWLEQCFVWNARQDENEFSYRKALAKQRAEKKEQLRLAKIEKEVDRGVDPSMFFFFFAPFPRFMVLFTPNLLGRDVYCPHRPYILSIRSQAHSGYRG